MYPNIIEMGETKGLKISKGQSESVKRRITYTTMPFVEQELLTSLKHPDITPVYSGVRVDKSLVFSVLLCG
jgi:hypothetical protein